MLEVDLRKQTLEILNSNNIGYYRTTTFGTNPTVRIMAKSKTDMYLVGSSRIQQDFFECNAITSKVLIPEDFKEADKRKCFQACTNNSNCILLDTNGFRLFVPSNTKIIKHNLDTSASFIEVNLTPVTFEEAKQDHWRDINVKLEVDKAVTSYLDLDYTNNY